MTLPAEVDRRGLLRDALARIEELEAKLRQAEGARTGPIAIIGMGCRFPGGVKEPEAFWRLLRDGVDAIGEVPPDRWDLDAYYDPDPDAPGKMYTRFGGFLDEIALFDADFFGIAPREALKMDPQHRLFLEVSWEALESAGLPPERLEGSRTGVFLGITGNDHVHRLHLQGPEHIDAYQLTGGCFNFAAGRLAYLLGLQGPTLTVDTACSSSLVAVHLACQSLRAGECGLALAGGVNVILSPEMTITLSKARMLAPDGRCKTFDAAANGYVRGEGCGVVVLKRLADALQNRDPVFAVIRGSAVNQDGRSSGLTVPSKLAQEAVIREALAAAGVEPAEVGYIEAHGTGTSLGDPIEVRALGAVLGQGRPKDRPFLLGSVKTNIGHLESAAGVAGLIKVVLTLQKGEIPPHLHFRTPSPHIAWDELPAAVPTSLSSWPAGGRRIAGLSSFGGSGTNAHIVLEEAPSPTPRPPGAERPLHLLTLSAKSEQGLLTLAGRWERHLAEGAETCLADVAFTASAGRSHFPQRAAFVASSRDTARERLRELASGQEAPLLLRGTARARGKSKVAFLFTGQGAQYPGMGGELYETQPTFQRALERCAEILKGRLEQPLLAVMFGEEEAGARLDETAYTQPALFALEYALAELWRSWGVEPTWVLGHSLGEYVAACVAGVLSLEDALTLIAERARLMQALPRVGAMVAVRAGEGRVREALGPAAREVAIAAVNGPESVVLSGRRAAVEGVVRELEGSGVKTKGLAVSHAFHSHLVEPMRAEFERVAAEIQYEAPRVGLVSNVTGRLLQAGEVDAAYWGRHLRAPVRFQAGMETLQAQGCDLFLEVGPAPVLLGLGRECLGGGAGAWLPSLRRGRGDWEQMLTSLGALYVRGVEIDWAGYDRDYPRKKVALPTSPFLGQRYWIEPRACRPVSQRGESRVHPLLGIRVPAALTQTIYERVFSVEELPYLADHRVQGKVVVPAAVYAEMGLAAATLERDGVAPAVHDLLVREPVVLEPGASLVVQSIMSPDDHGRARLQVFSRRVGDAKWSLHAEARLQDGDAPAPERRVAPAELAVRCPASVPVEEHYEALRRRGLEFGSAFSGLDALQRGEGEALGRIRLPDVVKRDIQAYRLHPALMDACLQVVGALLPDGDGATDAYLPISLGRLSLHRQAPEHVWSHVRMRAETAPGADALTFDVCILDEGGAIVAEVAELCLKRAAAGILGRHAPEEDWFYELTWEPRPLAALASLPAPGAAPPLAPIADHVARLLRPLGEQHLAVYRQLLPQIEELSAAYVLLAMHRLGWDWRAGEPVSPDALARQLGIADGHRRLFGRFLDILAEGGVLRKAGAGFEVARTPEVPTAEALSRRAAGLLERLPESRAQITLLTRCGECLAETLRGERDPLELLFPGGSLALAEALNHDTPFARFHNAVMQQVVSQLLKNRPADGKLRVLEVGAGTGSTTSYVLPLLPVPSTEYVFTDLSTLFGARAQEKFLAYPFVRYAVLNIENDPVPQGFAPHSFDLMIAANVLHATRDLGETLANVRRLLASDGTLLLLEGTEPQRWVDLTFGLTEGWWRFADTDRRPSYPLLGHEAWRHLLAEAGFSESVLIPEPAVAEARECQQAVIVARGPRNGVDAVDGRGRWLILADAGGVGNTLAEQLRARGETAVLVPADAGKTADAPALARLLSENGDAAVWRGVVHLWSLDATPSEATTLRSLEADVARSCGSVLHLVQALATASGVKCRGLWLVTRGTEAAGDSPSVSIAQSPLAGLAKVITLEHPELHCVHVDLDPAPDAKAVDGLLRELTAPDGEEQVALRAGLRLAARIVRKTPEAAAGEAAPVGLEIAERGVLDRLELRPAVRRRPGPGEVELRVEASGLNFRDVLSALDMYPGQPGPLGVECAGRVVAVGGGVEDLRVGDEVLALAVGSLATYVTTSASLTVRKPAKMSAEEGATIPSAFLTAWYGLNHLGRISPGDKILIHAAAGGVGLAAVQLARRAGAEVLVTAGSPEKRQFLRSLGIAHVMDSRSLEFARDVMEKTGGRGVDLVLNSLTGEFIPAGLSVLAPGGRFIELGRREVWDQERVAQVRSGVVYATFNLLEIAQADPALIRSLLRAVMEAFRAGELTPLPLRNFPLDDAVSAFRHMAQARHIGKIVLTPPSATLTRVDSTRFRQDATYLVTGGLGGLGLRVARWMADGGARNLVLVGRSKPDAVAREVVAALQKDGVAVEVARADVSCQEQMAALLEGIRRGGLPLRGVIHVAGTLDDGILLQQDWSRFARVMAAKVSGSWILHTLTGDCPIDFFVLFSSAVALLGRAGQGNHAAANAFEDALAHHRRSRGLPAISVNWGAWGEVGSVTRGNIGERIGSQGILAMAPEAGLRALQRVMEGDSPQVGVLAVDWSRYFAAFPPGRSPRLLAELAREARSLGAGAPAPAAEEVPFPRRLAEAPPSRRANLLVALAREQAVRVLALDPSRAIDPQQPLHELGLDSLMAVELRNALGAALGRTLPATLLFDYPTLERLASYLERLLHPEGPREPDAPSNGAEGRVRAVEELRSLSDEEAEAILLDELQAAKKRV